MFAALAVAQDDARHRRDAERNNSARLAFSTHRVNSSGVGNVRLQAALKFDVTFVEMPTFTQGSVVTKRPGGEWHLPVGTAGVWEWVRNRKGHYIGAKIHLETRVQRVDATPAVTWPKVAVAFDLIFMGVAFKDLGDEVYDEASAVAVRSVRLGG